PRWGDRFNVTRRCARVVIRACARSGTNRCGGTLVNHEPGPKTTQSASRTALTAWVLAGGSGGTREIERTLPLVLAQATWPRTVTSLSGQVGSTPATSATISSGTDDIGSTLPCAPSSCPTQSSPATESPNSSHRATMSRWPTACRSEEHTSELQSRFDLVWRLLLAKKK